MVGVRDAVVGVVRRKIWDSFFLYRGGGEVWRMAGWCVHKLELAIQLWRESGRGTVDILRVGGGKRIAAGRVRR